MEKQFLIEGFQDGTGGHVVQVTVSMNDTEIGSAQLPGGDFENAKGMAEGLKAMADAGVDLTAMLPDAEK